MRWMILVAAGCIAPYQAGSMPIAPHPAGDCLDVGLQIGQRLEAAGPVLVVRLGNRCDHHTDVDLARLRVVGSGEHGQTDLTPYDPRHEIGPRTIDARAWGEEWIEYEPAGSYDWLEVDLGRVAGDLATTWVRVPVPR